MAVVNDVELIELYNENRSEIFPPLRQEGTLTPLVILLAVLAPLYAQVNDGIDSADARWGLASLEFVSESGVESVAGQAAWQHPLAALLTGTTLQIPGLSLPMGLALVPVISAICVLLVWHSLCRALAGSRFAFWSAAIIACHGPFLMHVQSASATLLTLLFMLCALWGLFTHLQQAVGLVSGRLLGGGIALGLCLLTGGLATLVVIAVGVLLAVAVRFDIYRSASLGVSGSRSDWHGRWTILKSVAVMAMTAFAVGGWWVMMMAARSDTGFWVTWLGMAQTTEPIGSISETTDTLHAGLMAGLRLVDLLGVLFIPAVYGVWCVGRELWKQPDQKRRIALQFLIAWLLCGFVVWVMRLRSGTIESGVWDLFFIFPLVACTAFVIEQIAVRHCRLVIAMWLVCLALVFPLCLDAVRPSLLGRPQVDVWESVVPILVYLAAFAVVGIWLLIDVRRQEHRQRVCLVGLLILLAVSNVIQGFKSVKLSDEDRRTHRSLATFQRGLMKPESIDAQVLITDAAAPPDIEFVIRATRPDLSLDKVRDLNDGVARAAELIRGSKRNVLIVDWRMQVGSSARPTEQKLDIELQFTPIMVHGRRLSAYLLSRRIQPMQ